LVLVRHGESLYNRNGAEAGDDSSLTELGLRQAELVAGWLARNVKADALISSSLARARETAGAIAAATGLRALVEPGLEEAAQGYLHEFAPPDRDPLHVWDECWQPGPAAAPVYTAFRERLRAALGGILLTYAGCTVIVVCHGGVIGTIVRSVFGGHQVIVETENTGITHLCWRQGRWLLVAHNKTEHLAPLRCGEPNLPHP
jgi:probable phosphoglycerate mutase